MIQTAKLSKKFGSKTVLQGLDLTVQPGELVILQGANGAGKTTLIRILATLTRPTSGDFFIDGHQGSRQAELVRQRIGVMLHQPMLYGELTALENLRFYASLAGVNHSNDLCLEKLRQVGLEASRSTLVHNFSRGMQQRLSLARALIADPPVLLLDEPFTGLDAAHQDQLQEWLQELRLAGKTILVSDHNSHRDARMATRLDYLFHGKIVRSFEGKELDPLHIDEQVRRIESAMPLNANDSLEENP